MIDKEVEVTLLEIKNLYEYFYNAYRQPGLSLEWSKVTIQNIKYLETPYNQISNGVYDENKDMDFYDFTEKYKKLIKQYADRDEQGNIIYQNKEPGINEMLVEFNKDKDKLETEYKDLLTKIEEKSHSYFIEYKFPLKANIFKDPFISSFPGLSIIAKLSISLIL